MLRERLITAGLLIPPLLLLLYFGSWPLALLGFLVTLVMSYEFLSFSTPLDGGALYQRVAVIALVPVGYFFYGWAGLAWGILLAVILLFVLEILLIEHERHDPQFNNILSASLVCLCYCGVLGSVLFALSLHAQGNRAIFWLMMTVFLTDTGAYFGGKYFGGPPLSPRLSPKKTQSGAICGVVSGIGGSLLACFILGLWVQWPPFALFGLVVSVVGQFGDLAEFLLKRLYGVKDSGSILPGHGGLLDRIDGILFAAPVLFFGPLS